MKKTINMFKEAPSAMQNMLAMEKYLHEQTTLAPKLLELIKIRVSQINRCAYCLNMHVRDAIKIGEDEKRIHLVAAWRETSVFTPVEKVVLELAERVTHISHHEIDEALETEIFKYFSVKEYVDLLIAIAQINTWNRYNVSLHTEIE